MPAAAAPVAVAKSGSLHVQADVPGLSIEIDGIDRGRSPLTVPNLTPGEHQVVVRGDQRVTRRTVSIKAGETMTLVLSPPATGVAAPGWLSVTAPIVMQLRQDGKVIATTESDRVMLPSGEHEIEIANDTIGFRESRKITVAPGKTAEIAVTLPPAALSINAQPWAEVWVDGTKIGETPIANLTVTPGSHEVLFRHPQLGERRETVVVTLRQTARLGVDLRRP
jgi:hypothetical protein